MLPDEVGQHLRQAGRNKILRRAEPHPAAELRAGKIAAGPLVGFQDRARKALHRLAIGGGYHRVGVADEQPPSGFLLQLPNVLTDRGLAQAQPAARLAEIARVGDGKKTPAAPGPAWRSAYHEL